MLGQTAVIDRRYARTMDHEMIDRRLNKVSSKEVRAGIAGLAQHLSGRVLAVGDLMVDVFHYGAIDRISPEAPVPVMRLQQETRMLGGVGNVVRNIKDMGGGVTVVAPIGDDPNGQLAMAMLDEHGIHSALEVCTGRLTSVKTRFIAAGQQILRADREDVVRLSSDAEDRLLVAVAHEIEECDVVVLSDYGKGALTQRIVAQTLQMARRLGKPVLVDPKGRDFSVYTGAFCITPNKTELELATGLSTQGDSEVEQAARALLASTGVDYLLVTRSEKGMSLVARDMNDVVHLPAHKREVFDVSGAGDTVIGMLALCLASGGSVLEGAQLANIAAGVVVSKRGTATCTVAELQDELSFLQSDPLSKLRSQSDAAQIAAQWREAKLRIGFTNGCFDIIHPGHVRLLQQARARCDRLIVGLNADDSVKGLKGPGRPVQNEIARATVLAALAPVDMVVIFAEDTPLNLIEALRPDLLLKGADYTVGTVVGADVVLGNGGEVVLIDLVENMSTTNIIARIAK